jgi:ADP-heptose:LPS heptosyltransferase
VRIHVPGSGWALGDQVALLPTLREIRRRWPEERIEILGSHRPDLWQEFSGGTEESGREIRITHAWPPGASNLVEAFAYQAGVEIADLTPELRLTAEEKALDFDVDWSIRTVAVDVWANEPCRRWPVDRFQELARRLLAAGWQVLECGRESIGPRERIPCSRSFLNKLSVRETAALYRRCALWVGNDSGGFHLAASVGTPQVVLFSYINHPKRNYWTTVPVPPRTCACGPLKWDAKTCNLEKLPYGRCMTEISVDRVLAAVDVATRRFSRSEPAAPQEPERPSAWRRPTGECHATFRCAWKKPVGGTSVPSSSGAAGAPRSRRGGP